MSKARARMLGSYCSAEGPSERVRSVDGAALVFFCFSLLPDAETELGLWQKVKRERWRA